MKNVNSQAAPQGVPPLCVFQGSGNLYLKQKNSRWFLDRFLRNIALQDSFLISKHTVYIFLSCLLLFSVSDNILQFKNIRQIDRYR